MFRVLALHLLIAQASHAAPEGDWFASLYTPGGIELRQDDRVFALFSVFNALGLDQGTVLRSAPLPKMGYSKIRALVRERVRGADPEARRVADAFFDAHPLSLERYLAYVVETEPPPFEHRGKSGELKDFAEVLATAWKGWGLEELASEALGPHREALKAWIPVLDRPLSRARSALRIPDAVEFVVIANLLDAPDTVRATAGPQERVYLVVGPTQTPDAEGVVRELARLTLGPVVARQIGRWRGAGAVLREARLAGARETTVQDFATQALCTAVALKAIDAGDDRWDAASAGGYFGIRDAANLLDDAKPLDGWALDALNRIETRRPGKK